MNLSEKKSSLFRSLVSMSEWNLMWIQEQIWIKWILISFI